MLWIFILSLFLPFSYTHTVYTWLKMDDSKVLWNRNLYSSVERVCVPFKQPVNNGAMCASGKAGWKCLALYESNDCNEKDWHHEHISFFITKCSDDFDENFDTDSFDVYFNTTFYARSAMTYNC